MLKIKANNINKLIILLLIYRSVATDRQGIFSVTYWDKYIYGILCCCILFFSILLRQSGKYSISKIEKKIFLWIFVPIVITWIYSMLINVFSPFEFSGYFTRALSNVMFPLLSLLQGLMLFKYFGHKAIDITFAAYSLSYGTSIVVAFLNGGLNQFFLMMVDSTYNGSVLEMSELSPAFCLFLIYYLYEYKYRGLSKKKMIFREVICAFVLIIGMKRILIIASGIIIVVYFFLRNRTKNIRFWTRFMTIGVIFISFIYIYTIKSHLLFEILNKFNINTMSRAEFWLAIETTYSFSPLYLGHGTGFVSKWMDNNWHTFGIIGLNQTTGLHNDILKYYIDLGFIGFAMYLYWSLKSVSDRIAKILDNRAAFVYFLMMLLQVLCWFTDNISSYHVFLYPFYMIIFCLIDDVQKEKYHAKTLYN